MQKCTNYLRHVLQNFKNSSNTLNKCMGRISHVLRTATTQNEGCEGAVNEVENEDTSSKLTDNTEVASDFPVVSEKRLDNITRNRIKGPSGRRAPRNRNTAHFTNRASSLSVLPTANGDIRTSFSSLGCPVSRTPSDRVSVNSEGTRLQTCQEGDENTIQFEFSDIDRALFFGSSATITEEPAVKPVIEAVEKLPNAESKIKKKKKLSSLSFVRKSFRKRRKTDKCQEICSNNKCSTDLNENIASTSKSSSRCVVS